MNTFPEIITERLILRNLREADIASVYEIFSDDRVTEFYDLATFTDKAEAERLVAGRISRNALNGERGFRWAIALKTDPDILIGTCGFHSTNKAFHSIEIGYELHPVHWGKGYAFEAVSSVLSFCFANDFPFPLNRVSATTNLDSTKSIALLRRLGFSEEGVLRQYGYWKNAFQDVRMFSILRKEWNGLTATLNLKAREC